MNPYWVSAFLDFAPEDFERGVVFWGEVTGYDVSPSRGDEGEFATLVPRAGDDFLRVQRLSGGASRIHLDLHVADPRAEAERAVGLGATEVADRGYVVMASPAGLTFCFVTHPAATPPAPARWPGGRSQVDQVCVDIAPAAYDTECAFWQHLTGFEPTPTDSPEFRRLDGAGQPLRWLLQRLDDEQPARFHLDLSADDRAAEVARHVALGATETVRDGAGACSPTRRARRTASPTAGPGSLARVPRTKPPYAADELTMLRAFLEHHRDTLRWKTEGLTHEQLATRFPPSTLTLAGLVKHLAYVEDWWFGVNLAGAPAAAPFAEVDWDAQPDWEFDTAVDDTPEDLRALLDRTVAVSDAHVEAAGGVDVVAVRRHPETGEGLSLRWILLHVIEEYARHNGHADLLREAVDGSTGA